MISIYRQLRRYFVTATVLSVLVIFVLSNIGMTVFFNNYVQKANLKSDQKIVLYLQDILQTEEGMAWRNFSGLMQFVWGEEAEILLYDNSGTLLFDSRSMGMRRGMGHGQGMFMRPGNNDRPADALVYKDYPIEVQGKKLGKVEIGREKTILASAEDRSFVYTMNAVYFMALLLSILLVLLMSKYLTGKFLQPLLIVKNNIQAIAGKEQKKISTITSNTAEIQELFQATEELAGRIEEQDKLRKRLTSDIAHELRTPLATLQSHLEAFIDGIWEPTPQRLSYCYDELIRLTRLINDLNELSVIESDKMPLNISAVNLSLLLEDMADNFRPLFSEKNINFQSIISQNVVINGDSDRLKQVFVNILSNSYKYTPEQGKVNIRLQSEPGWAVTRIEDTGIGISPQDLPFIFERFYRGDVSRNRESGGAGIGLTIAKALVEAHHGTLEVQSQIGAGTSVRIKFPLTP